MPSSKPGNQTIKQNTDHHKNKTQSKSANKKTRKQTDRPQLNRIRFDYKSTSKEQRANTSKTRPIMTSVTIAESSIQAETKPPPAAATTSPSNPCWVCKKNPISYQPQSCDCAIYCKSCAMKMATGGRCKKCGKMFAGM